MRSLQMQRLACVAASLGLHIALFAVVADPTLQRANMEASAPRATTVPLIATFLFEGDLATPHGRSYSVRLAPTLEPLKSIQLPMPILPDIQPVAADSFEESKQIESLDDLAEVERLQGIYVKQINDRLARVLRMLAARRAVPSGPCLVHVIQSERGEVIDVDTNECARSREERQRLASAVRAASPLPSPPAGLAMGSYLTLDVTSL